MGDGFVKAKPLRSFWGFLSIFEARRAKNCKLTR